MNVFARLPDATATASQPIPYRTESPITTGKALSVFGMTIALLAAAVGLLLWTRKRGWLQRWTSNIRSDKAGHGAPRVMGQTRLGKVSRAYVIDVDGSQFVVVESSRHVSMHALPEGNTLSGEGHE